jgi:glutaredoxin
VAAKKMLDDKGLSYKEINIEEEGISRDDLIKLTGGFTVPQILIDNVPIGGFDKLLLLDQTGKLKELLGHS